MGSMKAFDLTVIGGGIVGLAIARKLALECPKLRLCVVDKEKELAYHQSMRNSGVVHSGVYYKNGSIKSRLCRKGAQMTKEYCLAKNLSYQQCGKLIVASDSSDLQRLHDLFEIGKNNQVPGLELWNSKQVQALQPECSNALEAIWSPETAIVDWRQIALSYADEFIANGGTIYAPFSVYTFKTTNTPNCQEILLEDANTGISLRTKAVVNCAGVYSDYLARQTGNNEHPKTVPFRGNYYFLSDKLAPSIKTNIYPVPDPELPFLGIHLTPRVDGKVLIGPTAALVLDYEKYTNYSPPNMLSAYHILFRSGIRKTFYNRSLIKAALKERKLASSKEAFAKEVRKLLPKLDSNDLVFTEFSGIRAQAVNYDGKFVDDFIFETGLWSDYRKVLHIRNCPSPAATSSQAIAEQVYDIIRERLL